MTEAQIVGKNVKEQRLKSGMKQWEVARILAVSLTAYKEIELGSEDITIYKIPELAKIFRVEPCVLYKGLTVVGWIN